MGQDGGGRAVSVADLPGRVLPEANNPRKRLGQIGSGQGVVGIQNLKQVVVVAHRTEPAVESRDPAGVHQGTRDRDARLVKKRAVDAGRVEAEQVDLDLGTEGLEELEGLQCQPAPLPQVRHYEEDSDLQPSPEPPKPPPVPSLGRREDANRCTSFRATPLLKPMTSSASERISLPFPR